jgi:LysR family transcriptional regulator, carnitine catabolism transcriptional activator
MNLTQRQLSMFIITAKQGNVSRASELLHISQPALTRALKEFERQLGFELFVRTTRRLQLTLRGEQFLPTATRLLKQMELALQDLKNQSKGLSGSLSIAVGTAFGATILPKVLSQLAKSHPGLRVGVIDDNSAGITQRVVRAEVELGIGTPVGDTHGLRCQRLLEAPLGLLGTSHDLAQRKSISSRDLKGVALLQEPADTSIASLLRIRGSDLINDMSYGHSVSSLSIQIAMAKEQLGLAMVSALGASHPQASGMYFVELKPSIVRELFLMTNRGVAPSAAVLAFSAILKMLPSEAIQGLHPAVSWSVHTDQ